jgi:beta-ureidopropionase / N-carbamoyl-L-amino-acid hydrolase
MQIKPERLLANLRELASIGKFETGVNRPAFSAADLTAREWLRERMTDAGLDATIDRVGNVYGRRPGVDRAVLLGSHSDTVPYGGWLDGSLGVIYALEITRAVSEGGATENPGVDVVSFQDEEGTFLALLGSRSFCGEEIAADIEKASSKDGRALTAALADSGLNSLPAARLDPSRHIGFLEAHIEQGPRLERGDLKIGIVSAIVGIRTFRVIFRGQADHAGTTPMSMRRDAGAAALRYGSRVGDRLGERGSPDTVWNVGSVAFKPGASNVVPNEAELVLQFRDPSEHRLEELEQIIRQTAIECAETFNAEAEVARLLNTRPAAMDPNLADVIRRGAEEIDAPHIMMPSGAGHDAMVLARHLPAAMLFVPSIGGRSHHVSEDTKEEDIVLGARVLLRAVELLLLGEKRAGGSDAFRR